MTGGKRKTITDDVCSYSCMTGVPHSCSQHRADAFRSRRKKRNKRTSVVGDFDSRGQCGGTVDWLKTRVTGLQNPPDSTVDLIVVKRVKQVIKKSHKNECLERH